MAGLGQVFNANDHESMGDFSPIPAGEYLAVITESAFKATKDGTGEYLQMKLEVIDGDYKGRNLFVRLNLVNKNPQAVEIAKRELATIGRATGVLVANDSAQFHDKPMMVKVGIKPGSGEYGPGNEVKGYSPFGVASGSNSTHSPATASLTTKKPWER